MTNKLERLEYLSTSNGINYMIAEICRECGGIDFDKGLNKTDLYNDMYRIFTNMEIYKLYLTVGMLSRFVSMKKARKAQKRREKVGITTSIIYWEESIERYILFPNKDKAYEHALKRNAILGIEY